MGNGTCKQQFPSFATINHSDQKQHLPNSQSQSPTKPTIDSINPTIAKIEDEGPNISFEGEVDDCSISKLSQVESPTKEISKKRYSYEDQFFLELFSKDKTFFRRSSQGQSISPVRIISTQHQKNKTSFIIEHKELIKLRQEDANEIYIPKSILKSSYCSEKSFSSQSKKKVKFGLIYKQI
ncbi:unnamed protein product [Paramecium sonneborni]|uniref:Uncharacterized protein n=1 Tax=Paramecium sonneborni TaxID=65129 RepID=A0A8S1QWE0_9CILI|nr:unnamed protein product [Paramecium sonneborni]CAD8119077.1 unnamed protein product [Paramecium sonneborni]